MGSMTLAEYALLHKYIMQYHNPFSTGEGKRVRYMHPSIDMRDGRVFAVTIRGFGFEDKVLHTQNEWSNCDKTLYERCLEFVNER